MDLSKAKLIEGPCWHAKMSLTLNEPLPPSIHRKPTEHRSCMQNYQLAMESAFESRITLILLVVGGKMVTIPGDGDAWLLHADQGVEMKTLVQRL